MTAARRHIALPAGLVPRGLTRQEAAGYLGISVNKFSAIVADGRMPRPKVIDGCVRWDRHALDTAWERLPDGAGGARPEEDGDDIWSRVAS